MSINIRLPNITAQNESGKLAQVQSYMYQLVEQLNWALNALETSRPGATQPTVKIQQSEALSPKEAEDTFNSIKALIIKSADIVMAYEKTILTDFDGKYFADSDFGTYLEETNRKIEENSKGVTETYKNIQTITNSEGTGALDTLQDNVRTTNAYIKRGFLEYDKDDGHAIYGIEIGETSDNGTFKQYAQFTAEKLTFFDVNKNPVAYIGAGTEDKENTNCLYITGKAVFQGDIKFGKYYADTSDGLAFTWIGG